MACHGTSIAHGIAAGSISNRLLMAPGCGALNSYQVKEGEDPCSMASEYELSDEGVSAR